jgi:hypothetical protein
MNATIDRSPTDPTIVKTIDSYTDAMVECLVNLRSRWADEKGCEDINDYMKVITEKLKLFITDADDVVAGKWLVTFRLPNNRWYSYYLKGSTGGWKRIK